MLLRSVHVPVQSRTRRNLAVKSYFYTQGVVEKNDTYRLGCIEIVQFAHGPFVYNAARFYAEIRFRQCKKSVQRNHKGARIFASEHFCQIDQFVRHQINLPDTGSHSSIGKYISGSSISIKWYTVNLYTLPNSMSLGAKGKARLPAVDFRPS